MATIEDLKQEVERLTRELDLATSEINQSAKYGLGLLDEKQTLQAKCEELENLYENSRHELEITQEVSNFFTCFLRFSVKALGSVGIVDEIASLEVVLGSQKFSFFVSGLEKKVLSLTRPTLYNDP